MKLNLHKTGIDMKTTQLLLLLLFTNQIMAGEKNQGEDLGLTEAQKEQMQQVRASTQNRLAAARTEIHAQAKQEMAEFLTAEQLAHVEERMQHRLARAEHLEEHAGHRKERKQQKRSARMKRHNNHENEKVK
jgi:Spy/CpxP family protein refolding chaperone